MFKTLHIVIMGSISIASQYAPHSSILHILGLDELKTRQIITAEQNLR